MESFGCCQTFKKKFFYNMTKIQIMQVYWDGWMHGVLHK